VPEIKIIVPDGMTIKFVGPDGAELAVIGRAEAGDAVERYFRDYLSANARKVYTAAARIELFSGPGYTLQDIASNISQTYESVRVETVRSQHRTSGRTAKRWREENGTDAPIRLIGTWDDEAQHYNYQLPSGIAERVDAIASTVGFYPTTSSA
jgi:hypothetical protein